MKGYPLEESTQEEGTTIRSVFHESINYHEIYSMGNLLCVMVR